jgi:hypothetical protein
MGDTVSEGSDDGTLTPGERIELQRIADKYNTRIVVGGSRAAGRGRNIYTDLPVGKDPFDAPGTTRSDIDVVIDGRADLESYAKSRARHDIDGSPVVTLSDEIKALPGGAGRIASTTLGLRPPTAPYILFRPRQKEVWVHE